MGLSTVPLKQLDRIAILISVVVLILVVMMRRVKIPTEIDFSFLPPFHATLNGITAIVLLIALYFIKQRNIEAHRKSMLLAIGLSVMFLLSYVLYHFTTEETRFGGEGTIRYVYFFILITHIILAAVILPFILFTFNRAITNQITRHKKLARWVFPIWLYVAITGPLCYFMLKPYYQ
jgi:putative membrane protein